MLYICDLTLCFLHQPLEGFTSTTPGVTSGTEKCWDPWQHCNEVVCPEKFKCCGDVGRMVHLCYLHMYVGSVYQPDHCNSHESVVQLVTGGIESVLYLQQCTSDVHVLIHILCVSEGCVWFCYYLECSDVLSWCSEFTVAGTTSQVLKNLVWTSFTDISTNALSSILLTVWLFRSFHFPPPQTNLPLRLPTY